MSRRQATTLGSTCSTLASMSRRRLEAASFWAGRLAGAKAARSRTAATIGNRESGVGSRGMGTGSGESGIGSGESGVLPMAYGLYPIAYGLYPIAYYIKPMT